MIAVIVIILFIVLVIVFLYMLFSPKSSEVNIGMNALAKLRNGETVRVFGQGVCTKYSIETGCVLVSYAWGTFPGLAVRRKSLRWRIKASDLPQEGMILRWMHNPLQQFIIPGYVLDRSQTTNLVNSRFSIFLSNDLSNKDRAKTCRGLYAVSNDILALSEPIELSLRGNVLFITLIVSLNSGDDLISNVRICESLAERFLSNYRLHQAD